MGSTADLQDQQHPRAQGDRAIVNRLLQASIDDYHLVELGRLRIRYQNFPGARDIQQDLDRILQNWGLSEAELFAKTQQIHAQGLVYRQNLDKDNPQDWS